MKRGSVKKGSLKPDGARQEGAASGSMRPASGPARDVEGTPGQGSAAGARYDHEEWLLDEALVETFPASDPIAPAQLPEDEVP